MKTSNNVRTRRRVFAHVATRQSALAVIFMTLAASGLSQGQIIPGGVLFKGLNHQPLGAAQVSVQSGGPAGEHLVVSNIGSSGLDGVSVDLGESTQWDMDLRPLTQADFPPGAKIFVQTAAELGGFPNQPAAGIRICNLGPEIEVRPTFQHVGPNAPILVQFRLNGQLVANRPVRQQQLAGVRWAVDSFFDVTYKIDYRTGNQRDECQPNQSGCRLCLRRTDGQANEFVFGNTTFFADEVDYLYIPGPDSPTLGAVNRAGVRGSGFPRLIVDCEGNRQGRNLGRFPVSALGEAQVSQSAGGDHLTISNIGSSGEDGVSVDLGESTLGFEAQWLPIAPHGLQVEAKGDLGSSAAGQPPETFGHVTVVMNPVDSFLNVSSDLSPLGSPDVRVQVFLGGIPQGEATLPTGPTAPPVAQVRSAGPTAPPPHISGCGKLPGQWPFPPCFILTFPQPYPIQLGDGTTLPGDELRVLAEGTTETIKSLRCLNVQATTAQPVIDIELVALSLRSLDPVEIETVTPDTGGEGTIVKIDVVGTPAKEKDICAFIKLPDGTIIPLEVLAVQPGCIWVRVGPVPQGAPTRENLHRSGTRDR